MSVQFSYQSKIKIKDATKVKQLLHNVINQEGFSLDSLSIVFTSDAFLYDMNLKYLNHDYYTDIITFDLATPKNQSINGELYISVDRARDNSKQRSIPIQNELRRLMIHGLLHLCGYQDATPSTKKIMTDREDHYLKLC
ncbi:MAG: rRNA maturation RNase YbeY [bacterium]|jgi:probable rRNA maturation factor